jgi:hypothetical protein
MMKTCAVLMSLMGVLVRGGLTGLLSSTTTTSSIASEGGTKPVDLSPEDTALIKVSNAFPKDFILLTNI